MYKFIKNKVDFGSGYHEIIDKVEIDGEILEVESTIDDHKYIKCSLDKFHKYIKDEYFTGEIGFIISKDKLPYYIHQIFLTKEAMDKYTLKLQIGFYYDEIVLNWSLGFFGWNFEKNLKEFILDDIEKIDINSSENFEYYGIDINITIKKLDLVCNYIEKYINKITKNYENTIKQLNNYEESIMSNIYNIPVDSKLKTALKQYLIYFPEYIEKAKGKKIKFEVTSTDEFLNIHIGKNADIDVVNDYLMEYVGFIKTSIDKINPEIRSDLDKSESELLIIELKSQIRNLKTSMEIKNLEKKFLDEQVHMLKDLLNYCIKDDFNKNITFNISSNSNCMVASNINFNVRREVENLQDELFDIKEIFKYPNDNIKDELNYIDAELMKLDDSNIEEDVKKNKHIFKRIRRILEKINDSNSDMNKIIKQSKEVVRKIQKIAKTYNKFAVWLSMPQIPSIFVEDK